MDELGGEEDQGGGGDALLAAQGPIAPPVVKDLAQQTVTEELSKMERLGFTDINVLKEVLPLAGIYTPASSL